MLMGYVKTAVLDPACSYDLILAFLHNPWLCGFLAWNSIAFCTTQ